MGFQVLSIFRCIAVVLTLLSTAKSGHADPGSGDCSWKARVEALRQRREDSIKVQLLQARASQVSQWWLDTQSSSGDASQAPSEGADYAAATVPAAATPDSEDRPPFPDRDNADVDAWLDEVKKRGVEQELVEDVRKSLGKEGAPTLSEKVSALRAALGFSALVVEDSWSTDPGSPARDLDACFVGVTDEERWRNWSTLFEGSPGNAGGFWLPKSGSALPTSSGLEAARALLLLKIPEVADNDASVQRWMLNVQTATAEPADTGKSLELLQQLAKLKAFLRTRFHRRLMDVFVDVELAEPQKISVPKVEAAEEAAWQWLVNLEALGGGAALSQGLGLKPQDNPQWCGSEGEATCPEVLVAKEVALTFASFTSEVLTPHSCDLRQLELESPVGRILFYEACEGELQRNDLRSLELTQRFAQSFASDGRHSRAYELLWGGVRRVDAGPTPVGVSGEFRARLLLDAARASLKVGRAEEAVATANGVTQRTTHRDTLRGARELLAEALTELGGDAGAARNYTSAERLLDWQSPERRTASWTLRSLSTRARIRAALNDASMTLSAGQILDVEELLEEGQRLHPHGWSGEQSELLTALAKIEEARNHWMSAGKHFLTAFQKLDRLDVANADPHKFAAEYCSFLIRRGRQHEAASFARRLLNQRSQHNSNTCPETSPRHAGSWARLAGFVLSDALEQERAISPKSVDQLESCLKHALSGSESVSELRQIHLSLSSINDAAAVALQKKTASNSVHKAAFQILLLLKTELERREAYSTAELLGGYQLDVGNRSTSADRTSSDSEHAALHYFSFHKHSPRTRQLETHLLLVCDFRSNERPLEVHDLGKVGEVDAIVRWAARRTSNKNSNPLAALQKAYRALIPSAVAFPPPVRHLLIDPLGALQALPFAALHDGKRFLAQTFRISYAVEHQPLKRGQTQATEKLLVVGDPAFEGRLTYALAERDGSYMREKVWSSLPRLNGARAEVREVARSLPSNWQATILSGTAATEKAIREEVTKSYRVVHLATHGLARTKGALGVDYDARKEQVALALSQGNDPQRLASNDGWLTEQEVAGLALKNTELVVLSACETGLGSAREGVQLAGLRRAILLQANAHSVVSSLWKISDAATVEFMRYFYGELAHGRSRLDALDEAARQLRVRYKHPYYWAAFQLHGETEPLGAH